jgi:phosphotransferase system HPr-like phosphotransfer protein
MEVIYMRSMTIKLDSIDKVKKFVNLTNRFEGDIDLVSNRYVVDAKSIMGIFSLNLSEALTLKVYNENEFDEIAGEIKEYAV